MQLQVKIPDKAKSLKHELLSAKFVQMQSIDDLRKLLQSDLPTMLECINNGTYSEFSISKKKGGTRLISVPCNTLKIFQHILGTYLQAHYYTCKPTCAHGFIKKPEDVNETHNIVSNASPHLGKKFVMNIDLEDYFPSIRVARVRKLFASYLFKFTDDIALTLALLLTHNGCLPTGVSTSPVVANFITIPLDNELMRYCELYGISYTRYADDLTFSNNEFIDDITIAQIKAIIVKHKFTVNEKKFRIQSAMRQQKVTGLVVNQKVNVDRKYIKKIRAMLHHAKTVGLSAACAKHHKLKDAPTKEEVLQFTYRLKGMIEFVSMVRGKEDAMVKRYKKEFNDLNIVL